MKKRSNTFLHILQHISFVAAAVALALMSIGAHVVVEDAKGVKYYNVYDKEGVSFEDSTLFNEILGNNVYDIICYGAIRGQMETNGEYDAKKPVDVTAFANRYEGSMQEYITAEYYLEDLIKWARYGFETEEAFMTGKEVDDFLSKMRTVTYVDYEDGDYAGGTISYLNSDIKKNTHVMDVSGNMMSENGDSMRDDTHATIMKNRYQTIDGKNIEKYVFSWNEYYELCDNVQKAAEDLQINYEEYLKYNEYYDDENSNIVYYIRKTIGDEVIVYSNKEVKSDKLSVLEESLKEECSKYIYYDPEKMVYDTNTMIEEETVRYVLNGYEYAYPANTQILIGVTDSYHALDVFSQVKNGFDNYSPHFGLYLSIAICSVILYMLLLVVITINEGGRKQEDKIPTEMMLVFAVLIAAAYAYVIIDGEISIIKALINNSALGIVTGAIALLTSLLFSFFYYSFVRRIKAKILWKNSLSRRLCLWIKKIMLHVYDNSSVVLRVWIPVILVILFNIILILTKRIPGAIIVGLTDIVIGVLYYKTALDRQRILKGINKINSGDTEHQIDEKGLHGDNLVLANAVNSIGEGIRSAVSTSMKDERLKADLITNVSHDIKTPLTSIINYVDLIKRENVENPKVKEYIEILDAKSQRLKQLTDDLVEASKISSGNIVLHWERINLVELLNQTIGEFSEKFEEKALTPIFRSSEKNVYINADSRRIWRVIENLFNNIFKYALAGTRIYIDMHTKQTDNGDAQVSLSILNISENPIKVNTEELTERFIRGDESRTTEGSGLGLSIAKNLTEVQKGKFEIVVDGDLFKVILTFPLLEEK